MTDDAAHESENERVNRELDQLLQELRAAMPGVQVLFAFLLSRAAGGSICSWTGGSFVAPRTDPPIV